MSILGNIKRATESLYHGRMDVVTYQDVTDPETHITGMQEVTKQEGIPCRLSYSSAPSTSGTQTATNTGQTIKVFYSPEIAIKSGSKLVITQNGQTTTYKASGEPKNYESHNEVEVELFERWV